ncbi:sialic acid synthase isoform X2 [Periplaneta americana]
MDSASVDVLDTLEVPFLKIGSGDANNFPLLKYAASKKKPMVVSTGMQSMDTVRAIYKLLKAAKCRFCLLHCVSAYPTPAQDVNLRVIQTYKTEFPDVPIGYSGHELGITISISAIAMGAQVLERHITLDKSWKGSDHICSLTPSEFRELVDQVRTVEAALGSPAKQFQSSEEPCYNKLGKTLVAARHLSAGMSITEENIKVKVAEPKGCPAEKLYEVIGKKLLRDVGEDESIMCDDLE